MSNRLLTFSAKDIFKCTNQKLSENNILTTATAITNFSAWLTSAEYQNKLKRLRVLQYRSVTKTITLFESTIKIQLQNY